MVLRALIHDINWLQQFVGLLEAVTSIFVWFTAWGEAPFTLVFDKQWTPSTHLQSYSWCFPGMTMRN